MNPPVLSLVLVSFTITYAFRVVNELCPESERIPSYCILRLVFKGYFELDIDREHRNNEVNRRICRFMPKKQNDIVGKAISTAKRFSIDLSRDNDVLCVLLRGSLVRGRFAKGCDIDLVAITGETDKQEVHRYEGFLVDCRYYSLAFVRSGIEKGDLRTMEHIGNSQLLTGSPKTYSQLKDMIEEARLYQISLRLFDNGTHRLNDAQDEMEYGDYDAAIMNVREAMTLLAKSLLLADGTICVKDKYIIRALRELPSDFSEFVETYFRVQDLPSSSKVASNQILELATAISFVNGFLKKICANENR